MLTKQNKRIDLLFYLLFFSSFLEVVSNLFSFVHILNAAKDASDRSPVMVNLTLTHCC